LQPMTVVGIKRLHDDLGVTTAKVCVTAANSDTTCQSHKRVLWGDLKTMFDPHVEDQEENMHIPMLVEKRYPLTPATITDMLNRKLQADHLHMVAASKMPMLKPGVETTIALITTKEKAQRRLELKARSTLLMGIPNEHQLKFTPSKMPSHYCRLLRRGLEGILQLKRLRVIFRESVEARLLVYKKNESVYEEDIKVLKCEIQLREVAITELRRKLELAQKQKDEIQLTVENFKNSSKNLSKLIDCQIVDKCKTEEFTSEPIVIKPIVENSEAKASEAKPKAITKNNGAPLIEDWVSDSEVEDVPQAKIEKKTVKPSFAKIEFVKPKEKNC
ncbi:hypothetical protein Tco_0604756, partial [Tanacetum coccineum]